MTPVFLLMGLQEYGEGESHIHKLELHMEWIYLWFFCPEKRAPVLYHHYCSVLVAALLSSDAAKSLGEHRCVKLKISLSWEGRF